MDKTAAIASAPTPPSASVRIDADTRAKLAELQKRLLDQSSRGPDIEVRRAGIPLGAVVEKALHALEKELDRDSSGLFRASSNTVDPNADAPKRTEQQNDGQNIPKSIPESNAEENAPPGERPRGDE